MRIKLTLSNLKRHRGYLWDLELTGFGAYVSQSGKVSWLVQRWRGKSVRLSIGRLPSMTLDEAREQARVLIGGFSAGIDIVALRRQKLDEQRQSLEAPTVGEVFAEYYALRNDGSNYWREVGRLFDRHVADSLGKLKLPEVTKHDIRLFIRNFSRSPSRQRWVFTFLRPFFKWTAREDYILFNPMQDLLPPPPANERDRVLSTDEIARVWAASTKMGYPFGDFVKLLLLTGQRRSEVAELPWAELDLSQALWRIPKERTKTKAAHIVYLSEPALVILHNIRRFNRSSYVFSTRKVSLTNPSRDHDVPITGFTKAKAELDRLSGVRDWIFHDLRRTAASGMCEIGIAPHVIDKVLNHSIPSKVRRIYQRFEYLQERKEALETWSQYLADTCIAGKDVRLDV
jgi:Site-specific recombinase XerD